jgi:predicted transcriptional regulator of viral defense system
VRKKSILGAIKDLNRAEFTTRELSMISGKSLSTVTQSLNNLVNDGVVVKIYRGIWAESGSAVSTYAVMPYLFTGHRAYVSFISALHLHGIIEQIPQVITIASTSHSRNIRTAAGVFQAHHIAGEFFSGYDWYKGEGSFLIAQPEKALIDCLYLSAHKKKRFGYFPELNLHSSFSVKKAEQWIHRIPSVKVRMHVFGKFKQILSKNR